MTPASTIKIATAVAALSALGPDHRITTPYGPGARRRTKSSSSAAATPPSRAQGPGGYASLRTLADATAAALTSAAGHRGDASPTTSRLYEGPEPPPDRHERQPRPVDRPDGRRGAPRRLDQRRLGTRRRPGGGRARDFADLLAERGIRTTTERPAQARSRAEAPSPTVSSPPLSTLVERMLTNSDNDIAEALARQTALATGEPAELRRRRGRPSTAQLKKLEVCR